MCGNFVALAHQREAMRDNFLGGDSLQLEAEDGPSVLFWFPPSGTLCLLHDFPECWRLLCSPLKTSATCVSSSTGFMCLACTVVDPVGKSSSCFSLGPNLSLGTDAVFRFSPFMIKKQQQKQQSILRLQITTHSVTSCVCAPHMGGVQTAGANILNVH